MPVGRGALAGREAIPGIPASPSSGGGGTTYWLRANGRTTDAFVYKDVGAAGAGISEVYLQCDLWLCGTLLADTLANLVTSQDFFAAVDVYHAGGGVYPVAASNYPTYDTEGLYVDGGASNHWSSDSAGDFSGLAATSGSHRVGMHIKKTTTQVYEFVIDGVTYTLPAGDLTGWITLIDSCLFGSILGGAVPTFLTNVCIGTTGYGSTDILFDDFSAGISASWTGAVGDCTVVTTIVCPSAPTNLGVILDSIFSLDTTPALAGGPVAGALGVALGGEGFRLA